MSAELQEIQQSFKQGNIDAALVSTLAFLKQNPNSADGHFLAANALRAKSRFAEAIKHLQQAMLVQPFHPAYKTLLAELHLDQGNVGEARSALGDALKADPDYPTANSLLGILELEANNPAAALKSLHQAAKKQPGSAQHHHNLGIAYQLLQRSNEAVAAFTQALKLNPNHPHARMSLARELAKLGADKEAAAQLGLILAEQPDQPEALYLVGKLCHKNGDFETAATYLHKAASQQPVNVTATNALAEFCWEQGDTETAIELYKISLAQEPTRIASLLGAHLTLPVAVSSLAQLQSSRDRFSAGLDLLSTAASPRAGNMHARALGDLNWSNFLLAYQGMDDRSLQARYGQWLTNAVHAILPEYSQPIALQPKKRAKIGFISGHLHNCTVGRYFGSWIRDLPREHFDIHVFSTGNVMDDHTKSLMNDLTWNHVQGLPTDHLASIVRASGMDVIIYPELGMNAALLPLAALRLAPIQLCAWGHPVTTGLPEIDGFLSCGEMEPDNADDHYVEKLYRLPGLGTRYNPVSRTSPAKTREQLGLPSAGSLYLFPQSVYKIHPDNDDLIADVLSKDPEGTLIMFATPRHRVANERLVRRLQGVLQDRLPGLNGRIRILPQASHPEYLEIAARCDVMIDTLHWSGGHTSIDALSVGLPVVTSKGQFMRGRQSAAMLRRMSLEMLICPTPQAMAEQSVYLAKSRTERNSISARITAAQDALFNDGEPVRRLAELLSKLTNPG